MARISYLAMPSPLTSSAAASSGGASQTGRPTWTPSGALSSQDQVAVVSGCPFRHLLQGRPALTTLTFSAKQPSHRVQLHIPTTGPLVYAKARRLSPAKLAVAKEEFASMEELGIIRRSCSPWASPLHIVGKKDGGLWPCGDF